MARRNARPRIHYPAIGGRLQNGITYECGWPPSGEVSGSHRSRRERVRRSFVPRGGWFAWYLDDRHGGGRQALWCKSSPEMCTALIEDDPVRFFLPPCLGRRGWVGVRLDVDDPLDWSQLADLIADGYGRVTRGGRGRGAGPPLRTRGPARNTSTRSFGELPAMTERTDSDD
jgi:hypothetical protein